MSIKSTFPRLLGVILISIVLIISSNTYVSAQLGGIQSGLPQNASHEVIDVPGGPGFIMLSPFDFRQKAPISFNSPYFLDYLYNPEAVRLEYIAGLTLPDGATIKQVTLYYGDSYIQEDLTLSLRRAGVDASNLPIATISSSGVLAGIHHLIATNLDSGLALVDNQNYSYYLVASFPGNALDEVLLINARVDYAYTVAAPLVLR